MLKNKLQTIVELSSVKHFLIAILIINLACNPPKKESLKEPFVKAEAPDAINENERGYILPGLDHGLLQSPINIITKDLEDGMHKVSTYYKSSKETVAYLGHTVQVDYDSGSQVQFDDKLYNFKQFHFHTPSEHHVDGITYPLEMHLVHTCAQHDESLDKPQYLVIAVFFKEGDENEFLKEFLSEIPEEEGEVWELPDKFIDVDDLLHEEVNDFYFYLGSLTTPPFTESVNWSILKKIYEASPAQIEKLNRLEGNNARHIQAVYDRKVEG